jgi:hypothetical protein
VKRNGKLTNKKTRGITMSRTKNLTYTLIAKVKKNGEVYKIETIKLSTKDVEKGLEITWKADDTEFEIWFPSERNPLSIPWWCRRFSIKSKNKIITRKLRKDLKGEYYYSIYCYRTKNMAVSNSSPRMIIRY